MAELFAETKALELIKTLPGLGFVLAVVILTEVGDVGRFPARVTLPRTRG
jgi:transposase